VATLPHVLIVEDNANASGALRVLFEATGHRVSIAATARAATSAILADAPDLVLLDLTLPDGDGFSVIQQVEAKGAKRPVFVALTGHDDPAIAQRCAEMGCADVMVKPVPARQLIEMAARLLNSGPRA
jgi:DNA-binding response OmpR family regulator